MTRKPRPDDELDGLRRLIEVLRTTGVTQYSTPALTLVLGDLRTSTTANPKHKDVPIDAFDLALTLRDPNQKEI